MKWDGVDNCNDFARVNAFSRFFQSVYKDSVCHTKLLMKLESYSIHNPLLKWFKSYLRGRLQRVVINGLCSAWKDVKSGVPQGSLFRPILFLINVNDMPNVTTRTTLAMFADDSKCYECIESIGDFDIIQGDLHDLLCWSLANEMNFQLSTCKNHWVSRKRTSQVRSYSLDGTSLIRERSGCHGYQGPIKHGLTINEMIYEMDHIFI